MEEFRDQLRLTTLRGVDPHAASVVAVAGRTALYNYNDNSTTWNKTDVEGTLMIYTRDAKPFRMITIINRNSKSNFIEPITRNCDAQIKTPYILLRNDKTKILGVWFADENDVPKIFQAIGNFIKLEEQETPSSENANNAPTILPVLNNAQKGVGNTTSSDDIMSMLSKAHGEYTTKKVDVGPDLKTLTQSNNSVQLNNQPNTLNNLNQNQGNIPEVSSGNNVAPVGNTVADFFAKVGVGLGPPFGSPPVSQQPQVQSIVNGNLSANVMPVTQPEGSTANPVLQQLFQGAAAVGGQATVLNNSSVSRAHPIPGSGSAAVNKTVDVPNVQAQGSMSLQELEGQLRKSMYIVSEEETVPTPAGFNRIPRDLEGQLQKNMFIVDNEEAAFGAKGVQSSPAIPSASPRSLMMAGPPGMNTATVPSIPAPIENIVHDPTLNLLEQNLSKEQDMRMLQAHQELEMKNLIKKQQEQREVFLLEQQQKKSQLPLNTENSGERKVRPLLDQNQFLLALNRALTKEEFVNQLYEAYEDVVMNRPFN